MLTLLTELAAQETLYLKNFTIATQKDFIPDMVNNRAKHK